MTCTQPTGWVASGGDCNPKEAAIYPGATEVCGDMVDNDCDSEADEGCVTPPPASHKVEVLLHCNPGSPVLGKYGPGTHTLPRGVSFIRFVGDTTGKVTLHNCDDRTMTITTNTNLCALPGGSSGARRWNDSVCKITVE